MTFSTLRDIVDTYPRKNVCTSLDMTSNAANTDANYITKIDNLLEHLNIIRNLQTVNSTNFYSSVFYNFYL